MLTEAVLVAIGMVASFIGSYAATQTHIAYLRRDVDHAHTRIDGIQKVLNHEK